MSTRGSISGYLTLFLLITLQTSFAQGPGPAVPELRGKSESAFAPAVGKCELGIVLLDSLRGPVPQPIPAEFGLRVFRCSLTVITLDTIRVIKESSALSGSTQADDVVEKLKEILAWLRKKLPDNDSQGDLEELTDEALEQLAAVRELMMEDPEGIRADCPRRIR